ncbi:MAG: AI-2E family transporter [Pedosphaera sp.]|nr:AI-2E family transporter [Pedosphaera sp.]
MRSPHQISYVFISILLLLVGVLQLATPLLTALFAYFAMTFLSFGRSRWLGLTLFLLLFGGVSAGFFLFIKHAYIVLPEIVDKTIPAVVEYAERIGAELPFTDLASFKVSALEMVKSKIVNVGQYARTATVEAVSLVIGVVVAVSLFLSIRLDFGAEPEAGEDNLYTATGREIAERFRGFYSSFARVMGAQMLISTINTAFTSTFLLWNGYPYVSVIIVLTFLCGMLPIIGNLLSNALIVGIGFNVSTHMPFAALVFLVVLHKGEYFLNSKIIGDRIRNPMWLTLLGLVIGEKLMGIPGMILAPVLLHFIKVEVSRNKLAPSQLPPS